jgi:aspartate racemase
VPEPSQIAVIQEIITTELEQGIVKSQSKKKILEIINHLSKHFGIEGVILGCTELPLILQQTDCRLTLYDTVELHTNALLTEMFK